MDRFVSMVEAKSKLAELVGQVKYSGKRYILRRRGEPVAVLIGIEEYRRLQSGVSGYPLSPALRQRQEALWPGRAVLSSVLATRWMAWPRFSTGCLPTMIRFGWKCNRSSDLSPR